MKAKDLKKGDCFRLKGYRNFRVLLFLIEIRPENGFIAIGNGDLGRLLIIDSDGKQLVVDPELEVKEHCPASAIDKILNT